MYERKEFRTLLLKMAVWYATGAPELHSFFDELTVKCSETQWAQVEETMDKVDEIMAESEIGSLYQKEKVVARREERPPRYPSIFEVNEEKAARQWRELADDYRKRGIVFKD